MTEQITIREFQESDRASLEQLMSEFGEYIMSIDPLKRVAYKDGGAKYYVDKMVTEARENNGKVYVAVNDNEIVGFIGGYIKPLTEEQLMEIKKELPGYISELYIQESFRGKRLGTTLMNTLEKYFISQGCDAVHTSVFSPNVLARSLYAKLGFHERVISIVKELK